MWWRKVIIVNYEQIKICDCPASILGSLALFQIRICDFSYPISNLNSSPGQSNNKMTHPLQGPGSIQHKILLYLILKQILSVYSLYKRITTPPPPSQRPRPSEWNFQGKKDISEIRHCVLNTSHRLTYYRQTRKTVNTRNISRMLLWCKKKANQVWENWSANKSIS